MNNTPKEYKILEVGETIQPGDEFWQIHDKIWVPSERIGGVVQSRLANRYRRALPAYSYLQPGDTIQPGDECLAEFSGGDLHWRPVTCTSGQRANRAGDFRRPLQKTEDTALAA